MTIQNPEDNNARSMKKRKDLSIEIKSTQPSLVKKRSQATIEIDSKEDKKLRKVKGVPFKSSSGHQYLKEVEDRKEKEKIP